MSPQKSYGLKNIFLLVCILLPVFSSFAQEADVGTCTTLLLTHKFTDRYSAMLRLECQTREMVTAVDMIYLRMQNRFKVLPWLQLELNGELNLVIWGIPNGGICSGFKSGRWGVSQ